MGSAGRLCGALPRRSAQSTWDTGAGPTAAEWVCGSLCGAVGGEGLTLTQAAGIVPGAERGRRAGDTAAAESLFLSAQAGPTLGKDGRTSLLLPGGA